MAAVSCTSCSATPTPASLVADAAAKGKLGSSEQKNGSVEPTTTSTLKNTDSVQISDTARQLLRQSLQGLPVANAASASADIYAKPSPSISSS